tara:strand:- start:386 stop:1531 length:1146 start_codon:yes stop_codon:yes gene_type:complete
MNTKFNKNNNKTNDAKLHEMRFFAQIAERAGYTIAGVGTAFMMNGVSGLISFGLIMLIFASLQSQIISLWKLDLTNLSLRISLAFRMTSFGLLSYGLISNNFSMMLIGAAFSGLFVGLFWPAFYHLKQESIGKWHLIEKISGVILTITTGFLVIYWNTLYVLIISFTASTIGLILTFKIENKEPSAVENIHEKNSDNGRLRFISILDGFNGETVRMIRRLAILSGAITIMNFDGILSFALVLGISEALGALIKQRTKFEIYEFSIIVVLGCLFCGILFNQWVIGLIIIGIGNAGIFPVVHEYVRIRTNSDDINFRERNRFNGRIFGAFFAAFIFVSSLNYTVVFVSVAFSTFIMWLIINFNKPSMPNLPSELSSSIMNTAV